MNENMLRRTKEKLRVLNETPYIKTLLADMLNVVDEHYYSVGTLLYLEPEAISHFIAELEIKYKKYIQENTPKDSRQLKVFEDE